jgi:rhamnose utilization protein RhaD (predicted bifunctional aldolase and dehydrogenase)
MISLACSANGRELCRELWGERVVWVDYVRPGFPLAKWIADGVRANPRADVVIMGKHGLTVWGDTSRACYEQTIRVIQEAEVFTQDRRRDRRVFASAAVPLSADERRRAWLALLPALRGALSAHRPAILQVDDGEAALAFVNGEDVIA